MVQKQRTFGSDTGHGGGVGTSAANKVRRGDIRHAVIVRTAKKYQRPDGSVIKFGDNACVLVNKAGDMVGTRLTGEFILKLRYGSIGIVLECWLTVRFLVASS